MNNRKTKSPTELASDFVTSTIDTASAAFNADTAKQGFDAVNQSAAAYQAKFSDLQLKGVEFAEVNTKAVFAFLRDVFAVKSPETLFSLQQNFVKNQAETAVRQAQDLNALTVELVRESTAPVQAGIAKAFASFQPAKAA